MKLQKHTITLVLPLVLAIVFAAGFSFTTAGRALTSFNKLPSQSDITGKNTITTNNIPVFTRLPLSVSESSAHLRMYNLAPKSCGIPRGYFAFNKVGSNVSRSSYRKIIEGTSNETNLLSLKPNTRYEYKQMLSFKDGSCKGVYEGAVRTFKTLAKEVPYVAKVENNIIQNTNNTSEGKISLNNENPNISIAPIINDVVNKTITSDTAKIAQVVPEIVPVGVKIIPTENKNDTVKVFIQIPEKTTYDYSFTASTGMNVANSDSIELVLDRNGYKINGASATKLVSFDILKNSDYIGKEFFLNTKIIDKNNVIASKNYTLDTYFVNDSNQFITERAINDIDPRKGVSSKTYIGFFLIGIGLLGLIKYVLVPKYENISMKVPIKKNK